MLEEFGRPLVVQDVDLAEPRAGEVLVRLVACGVCHTDLYTASGADPSGYAPTVLGHEGAGVVERVGDGVTSLSEGDHVVTLFSPQCGDCVHCSSPRTNLCLAIREQQNKGMLPDGTTRISRDGDGVRHFMGCSTFAEYTVMPEIALAKIDPEAPFEHACIFACGLSTGLGAAINTGGVRRGQSVAVIGCGGVGMAAVAGAALAGAARVIAVDIDDRKLEWAKGMGATDTVSSRQTDPVEAIQGLTGGFGADVVIDAVGRPETWQQAFYARDLAGTVVLVGVPTPDQRITLPLIDVFGRGGALKSSWYGDCLPSRDFPMLVDLYQQGRLDLDAFVTEEIGIDDVEAAFDKMHSGDVLRSVVIL